MDTGHYLTAGRLTAEKYKLIPNRFDKSHIWEECRSGHNRHSVFLKTKGPSTHSMSKSSDVLGKDSDLDEIRVS